MTFSPGQLVRHEHEDSSSHFIEGLVLRAVPERGPGFYQLLVLARGGYGYSHTVEVGTAVVTKLDRSYMSWRVLA